MKKSTWLVIVVALLFAVSCSMDPAVGKGSILDSMDGEPEDVAAWEATVNADFARVLDSLGTPEADRVLAQYDAKYGTSLLNEFSGNITKARSSSSGSSSYPPLMDMPFLNDGAVYLSGGATDLVGNVIGWVAPKNLPGGFYHGAALDIEKMDPNNADAPCLQTAITKGAGYETVNNWRNKVNVCVLDPKTTLVTARLNSAQLDLDYYCKASNTDQEYGFFKSKVNIFNVVSKSDLYTWYCTKVVWAIYNKYGLDIDSNSPQVDFTKSGLYSLVKTYYHTIYFYSSKKANAAINEYITDARAKIVLAEEIMLSPHFVKVYEKIRE